MSRPLLAVAIGSLLLGVLAGCASDSKAVADPTVDPSARTGAAQARELRRQQICENISRQLRAVSSSKPDGLFPFPEYRNRERDPASPNAEIYELKDMQRRYRCRD
ncbi:MAG: hypothetical protein ACC642_04565 [Pseudomonadales bacterium]